MASSSGKNGPNNGPSRISTWAHEHISAHIPIVQHIAPHTEKIQHTAGYHSMEKLIHWSQEQMGLKAKVKAEIEEETEQRLKREVIQAFTKPQQEESIAGKPWFNSMVGFFVIGNGVILGLQMDNDLGLVGEVCNHFFTFFWAGEVCVRACCQGIVKYLKSRWNRFDIFLALAAIFDTWILPLFSWPAGGYRMLTVLRVTRVVRILRLVKMLRAFNELWLLVNGFARAANLLVWVAILLAAYTYMGALYMTWVVGQECEDGSTFDGFPQCFEMFGTIPRSMYTLFQVVTLESWSMAVVRPVIEQKPETLVFWMAFILFSSFGLLNIVTGVIVEQVLKSANETVEKKIKEKEAQLVRDLTRLWDIFHKADADEGGSVSRSEFLAICETHEVQASFEELGLPVSRKRLAQRLFDVLDAEKKGEMEIGQLMERAWFLKQEGHSLNHDPTLLLMELRHLHRDVEQLHGDVNNMSKLLTNHPAVDTKPALRVSPAATERSSWEERVDVRLGRIEEQLSHLAGMESRIMAGFQAALAGSPHAGSPDVEKDDRLRL